MNIHIEIDLTKFFRWRKLNVFFSKKGKRTPCPHCNKLIHVTSLSRHIKIIHMKVKEFHCTVCNMSFTEKFKLMVHFQTSTHAKNSKIQNQDDSIQRKIDCPKCSEVLPTYKDFLIHLEKQHMTPLVYYCLKCTNTYFQEESSFKVSFL